MKKHLVVVFALSLILLPFLTHAQTNIAPLNPTNPTATISYITNLNTQIKKLAPNYSNRSTAITLRTLLKDRKNEMLNLAKTNPRLFLNQKLSPTIIQQIPPELRTNIEQPVSLSGNLEVMHVDDFDHPENSRYDYSLVVGHDKYELYPTQPIISASGAVLAVSGSRLDTILVVEAEIAGNLHILTPAPPPDSVGDQKTLILLINFLDSGPPLKTPQEIYDLTFNGQFQKFYQEQSYNKVRFTGDVKGWYTLPRNQRNNIGCLSPAMPSGFNETARLILDNNIDLSQYDRLVILDGCPGGFSTLGKISTVIGDKTFNLSIAWVSSYGPWFLLPFPGGSSVHSFSWTSFDHILSHEMGHSLGVLHANGWDCGENTLRGDCQFIDSGNYFDVMGREFYALHFNSFQKELLGWISPSETIEINSSGRYTLNPLELSGDKHSKKLAKIQSPLATSTTFYLEYRRGIGFDAKLNNSTLSSNQQGLFVNRIIYFPTYTQPFLLDMRPTAEDWFSDISLATLNSTTSKFTDFGTGISLGPIYEANSSSITFDVGITEPQCVRSNPTINNHSYTSRIAIGENGWINVNYSNGDSSSCGGSNFRVETSLSSIWQPIILPAGNVFISPDSTSGQNTSISFIVPIGTPPGSYSITVDIVNLTTNYKASETVELQIVNPPNTPSLTLTSPNGGELIPRGARAGYRITWQELNFPNPNSYKINLSLKSTSGVDRVLFSNLASGIGYQNWTVPKDLPTGRYKMSICVTATSTPCAYSDQSDDYFSIIETATIEPIPIVPVIPSPIDPTPVPTPTTTPPIIPTPTPAPIPIIPTLISADPPNNAIDARDLSGRLGWKFVSLSFSAHLGADWNLATNYTIPTTNAEPINIANISGSAVQPIAVFSRKIVPGERVTVTHQPTGAKVCL
ncbi:MAG: hypothetical protein V1704_03425, partial [Candidatus Vogelbacteria bacterium]